MAEPALAFFTPEIGVLFFLFDFRGIHFRPDRRRHRRRRLLLLVVGGRAVPLGLLRLQPTYRKNIGNCSLLTFTVTPLGIQKSVTISN